MKGGGGVLKPLEPLSKIKGKKDKKILANKVGGGGGCTRTLVVRQLEKWRLPLLTIQIKIRI